MIKQRKRQSSPKSVPSVDSKIGDL